MPSAVRLPAHWCRAFGSRNRVILIIEQDIQSVLARIQFFQLVQSFNGFRVECRQRTQRASPFSSLTSFSGLVGRAISRHRLDWRTGATTDRTDCAVRAVVNVLDIDTTGRGAFPHHQSENKVRPLFTRCLRMPPFSYFTYRRSNSSPSAKNASYSPAHRTDRTAYVAALRASGYTSKFVDWYAVTM